MKKNAIVSFGILALIGTAIVPFLGLADDSWPIIPDHIPLRKLELLRSEVVLLTPFAVPGSAQARTYSNGQQMDRARMQTWSHCSLQNHFPSATTVPAGNYLLRILGTHRSTYQPAGWNHDLEEATPERNATTGYFASLAGASSDTIYFQCFGIDRSTIPTVGDLRRAYGENNVIVRGQYRQ